MGAAGAQVHLDLRFCTVEESDVLELVEVEVGVELPVDDAQHVAVELSGDAGTIVVCSLEDLDRLHQIDPQQEVIAGAQLPAQLAQKLRGGRARQIADRTAKKEH